MTMNDKIKTELARTNAAEERLDEIELTIDDAVVCFDEIEESDIVEIEESDIVDEGKQGVGWIVYEAARGIERTGLFFRQGFSRSGDHWRGYEYYYEAPVEVVRKTKTVIVEEWVTVD